MALKFFKKKDKDARDEELKRKWAMEDPRSNELTERRHRDMIELMKTSLDRLSLSERKYYQQFVDYEFKWRNGEVNTYGEYWKRPSDHVKEWDLDLEAYKKRVKLYEKDLL